MKTALKCLLVFVGLIWALLAVLIFTPDVPISGETIKLGAGGYDMETVSAPSLSGSLLDSFSFDLASSRFGPWVRRMLLNNNNLEMIRELASQVPLPPLYYPIVRIKDEQWNEEARVAKLPGILD